MREIRDLIHSIQESMEDNIWDKWISMFKTSLLIQKAQHLAEMAENATDQSISNVITCLDAFRDPRTAKLADIWRYCLTYIQSQTDDEFEMNDQTTRICNFVTGCIRHQLLPLLMTAPSGRKIRDLLLTFLEESVGEKIMFVYDKHSADNENDKTILQIKKWKQWWTNKRRRESDETESESDDLLKPKLKRRRKSRYEI